MSRIQKKCFIASTGFHLFLVVLLFVGPGFFTSKSTIEDVSPLTIIPMTTTDADVQGGGSPKGGTPPPPQPQPQPQPEPPKPAVVQKAEKAPDPEPKETKVEKNDPESFEPAAKLKPKVSLKQVTRKNPTQLTKNTATRSPSSNTAPSKDLQALNNTVRNLQSGLSASTSIDMPLGPGGGGPTYGNFLAAVKKIYMDAWREPNGEDARDGRVDVVVVIARDGEVLSARITQPSGNPAVDQSVQAVLDRVRRAVPLPEGSGPKREVPIGFKVTVKQGSG